MLAIINLLAAIFLTILYAANIDLTLNLVGVLGLIIIFVIAFMLSALVLLIIFALFIYATEKLPPTKMWKRVIIHWYSIYLFRFFYRVRLKVTGQENLPKNNHFVVVSNHIEYSDPIFIMQAFHRFPIGYVAKDPLFKYPLLKNLMYSIGCVPISRFADRSALESILQAIKQVKNGQPMGIFPEGKRTYADTMIEFKPGAFKLAQKPKADIAPVVLYKMHDLSRKRRFLPTKVYLHILPVIKYDDYQSMDTVALSNHVYQLIRQKLDQYKETIA